MTSLFRGIGPFPHPHVALQEVEAVPCLFAAHLASQPTITRGTTIAAQLSHVRTLWRHNGCPKFYLTSKFGALGTRGTH